eukprot:941938-Prorocentrum_minimum.AAC.1
MSERGFCGAIHTAHSGPRSALWSGHHPADPLGVSSWEGAHDAAQRCGACVPRHLRGRRPHLGASGAHRTSQQQLGRRRGAPI